MSEVIKITGIEELDLEVYRMYKDISSMPVKKIERLRKVMHQELERENGSFEDPEGTQQFIDLLMDTCIKAAKRKSHQAGSYTEQNLAAEVIESLPQQDDSISFAV